jgi:hypothetical protein
VLRRCVEATPQAAESGNAAREHVEALWATAHHRRGPRVAGAMAIRELELELHKPS